MARIIGVRAGAASRAYRSRARGRPRERWPSGRRHLRSRRQWRRGLATGARHTVLTLDSDARGPASGASRRSKPPRRAPVAPGPATYPWGGCYRHDRQARRASAAPAATCRAWIVMSSVDRRRASSSSCHAPVGWVLGAVRESRVGPVPTGCMAGGNPDPRPRYQSPGGYVAQNGRGRGVAGRRVDRKGQPSGGHPGFWGIIRPRVPGRKARAVRRVT